MQRRSEAANRFDLGVTPPGYKEVTPLTEPLDPTRTYEVVTTAADGTAFPQPDGPWAGPAAVFRPDELAPGRYREGLGHLVDGDEEAFRASVHANPCAQPFPFNGWGVLALGPAAFGAAALGIFYDRRTVRRRPPPPTPASAQARQPVEDE